MQGDKAGGIRRMSGCDREMERPTVGWPLRVRHLAFLRGCIRLDKSRVGAATHRVRPSLSDVCRPN